MVSTRAVLARSEPHSSISVQTWPRPASVLDEDGRHLTDAVIVGPPRSDEIELEAVADSAALMDRYFGRGARSVMLVLDDRSVIGQLGTCWEGNRRRWWLALHT